MAKINNNFLKILNFDLIFVIYQKYILSIEMTILVINKKPFKKLISQFFEWFCI